MVIQFRFHVHRAVTPKYGIEHGEREGDGGVCGAMGVFVERVGGGDEGGCSGKRGIAHMTFDMARMTYLAGDGSKGGSLCITKFMNRVCHNFRRGARRYQ